MAGSAVLAMVGNQRAASVGGLGDIDVGTSTFTVGANGASSTTKLILHLIGGRCAVGQADTQAHRDAVAGRGR